MVKILKILRECTKYKCGIDFGILIFGVIAQIFLNHLIIEFVGLEKCNYLKTLSLMLGMASTIGLSTIVVFGFNLSKSVQQFWKGIIKEHGLNNQKELIMPAININYWLLILLILLYVCIALDWCTLFYILLIYDVLCYTLLIFTLWLIERVGDEYLFFIYCESDDTQKKNYLSNILQNSVDGDGRINISAVKTYIELLDNYLEYNRENQVSFYEKFYKKVKDILYDTMGMLVLDRAEQAKLLISVIREFCKMEASNIDSEKNQILLSVMISYALDRKNNVDIEYVYREITNWNDESLSVRFTIAVARMEYLYAISQNISEILLNDSIYCLYHPVPAEKSYKKLIYLLWYLWCREDEEIFLLRIESMERLIQMCQENLKIYNVTAAGESFYVLVNGLKY